MSQNKRFGGGVSKRTAEALVWVAIGLLVPLTLYLVMVSTVHLFILLAWLGLALIALSYALLVQLSSHHTIKELERAREHHASDRGQLITIINSMSVGMMSVSANGTIRLYNAALLALIDTNESITGKNVADVFNTYNKADDSRVDLMSLVEKRYMTRREDIVLKYDDNDQIRLGITINPVFKTI